MALKISFSGLLETLPKDFSLALQRNLDEFHIGEDATFLEIHKQLEIICTKTLEQNPFVDSDKQEMVKIILHFIAIAGAQLIGPRL